MEADKNIERLYGNKLRCRVVGICIEDDRILLVKHRGLTSAGYLWAPPGGGMEYGTSAEQNLVREFREEAGLHIKIKNFLFAFEYLWHPLHTVELFFEVEKISGDIAKGKDPEMADTEQIIAEVAFVPIEELGNLAQESLHHMLKGIFTKEDLLRKRGLFKFEKN